MAEKYNTNSYMLHALKHRKSRVHFDESRRTPVEDIITSTVFGPITYFSPSDATQVFATLFGIEKDSFESLDEMVFWPRRVIVADAHPYNARLHKERRDVEPDLMVFATGSLKTVIVEIKWDASIGANQLWLQWLTLSPVERESAFHILLAKNMGAANKKIEDQCEELESQPEALSQWMARFRSMSWHDLLKPLKQLTAERFSRPVRTWSGDALGALRELGIDSFVGFFSERLTPVEVLGKSQWSANSNRLFPSVKRYWTEMSSGESAMNFDNIVFNSFSNIVGLETDIEAMFKEFESRHHSRSDFRVTEQGKGFESTPLKRSQRAIWRSYKVAEYKSGRRGPAPAIGTVTLNLDLWRPLKTAGSPPPVARLPLVFLAYVSKDLGYDWYADELTLDENGRPVYSYEYSEEGLIAEDRLNLYHEDSKNRGTGVDGCWFFALALSAVQTPDDLDRFLVQPFNKLLKGEAASVALKDVPAVDFRDTASSTAPQ